MKKLLLAVGILFIAAGIIFLIFAAINLFGYCRVLDGSAELYARLHQRATVSFVTGIALAAVGAACVAFRARIL